MAMEAVPEGHQNWKSVLLSGHVVPAHFEQFARLLGTIQRRSSELARELRPAFRILSYFENLRLEPYYLYSAEKIPAAAGFLRTLVEETHHHRFSLVHGDFSPKNTLIYQGRLILIDHEVVHFGDPAFDVGFALTHFLSKAHHVHQERRRLADSAQLFWRTYAGQVSVLPWADTLEPRVVRHTLGCLLARVAGKSRLEYLGGLEMSRQSDVVLSLIAALPAGVPDLIDQFVNQIQLYDQARCQSLRDF